MTQEQVEQRLIESMVAYLEAKGFYVRLVTELHGSLEYTTKETPNGGLMYTFDITIPKQHLRAEKALADLDLISGRALDEHYQRALAHHLTSKVLAKATASLTDNVAFCIKQGVERAKEGRTDGRQETT